jgi:hypothetical protein
MTNALIIDTIAADGFIAARETRTERDEDGRPMGRAWQIADGIDGPGWWACPFAFFAAGDSDPTPLDRPDPDAPFGPFRSPHAALRAAFEAAQR